MVGEVLLILCAPGMQNGGQDSNPLPQEGVAQEHVRRFTAPSGGTGPSSSQPSPGHPTAKTRCQVKVFFDGKTLIINTEIRTYFSKFKQEGITLRGTTGTFVLHKILMLSTGLKPICF